MIMTKIFIDIETGGFNKQKDAICEIAAVATDADLHPIHQFHRYIQPYYQENGEPIRYKDEAMDINGIPLDFLSNKGDQIEYVLREFKEFVGLFKSPLVFVGHNAVCFDFPFIQYQFDRFYPYFDINHFSHEDTKFLAKRKLNLKSYSLHSLCEFFCVENEQAHSAMSDVFATIQVYKSLISV